MKRKSGIRAALFLQDIAVNKYIRDLIGWLHEHNVDLSCVVTGADRTDGSPAKRQLHSVRSSLGSAASRQLFRTIVWAESLLLRTYPVYRDHHRKYDLRRLARCVDADEGLRVDDFDLLIDCTGENLRCDRRTDRPFDVISLRHGEAADDPPGPPGFWEAYFRREGTAFTIEGRKRWSGEAGVVRTGKVITQFFFCLNQAHLYAKSHEHLKDVLSALIEGDSFDLTPRPRELTSTADRTIPSLRYSISYLLKVIYRLLLKAIRHLCSVRQSWNISIVPAHWDAATYWKSTAILPKKQYLADPFLYKIGETVACFAEEYIFTKRRGHISCCTITNDKREFTPIIEEPFHLSFPFVFECDGQLFMCPECEQKREIRIYRCVEFPYRWVLERVIMKDVSAVDTMIFGKDGRWWLLTNMDNAKTGDYCSDLYLFYANSPLAEEWTPHPQNPIKIDSCGGRNAGLLFEKDRICRVGQRQDFDQYGRGLHIFEIERIDEEVYREKLIWTIEPDFRKGMIGIHHLASIGEVTVFDSAGWRFVPGSLPLVRVIGTHRRGGTRTRKVDRFIALSKFAKGKFVGTGFPSERIE